MNRARRFSVLILCVAGAGYALLGAQTAADNMRTWTTPTLSGPWAGGEVWSVDTDYFEWAQDMMEPSDRFILVDGTGNIAVADWATYQLYPAVRTEDPSEADWVVLYGIDPEYAGPEVADFTEQITYADGFFLMGRTDAATGEEWSSDGQ